MTQTIMQAVIEAAKAAIMAVREVDTPVKTTKPTVVTSKTGDLVMKQPMFDWTSP